MSGTAAFGHGSWLPRSVQAAWRLEEQAERREARQAEVELAARVEARRSADLTLAAVMAAERGEVADPVGMAVGRVTGHSLADVLESARMAADREDAAAELEERRKRGERLNFMGELEDPATRSVPAMTATRRAIERASERFAAAVASQRQADAARGQLENVVPAVRAPHWASGRRRSR